MDREAWHAAVHGVLKARILKWFAIPISSGAHSVRSLHHDPPVLGGPTRHCLVSLPEVPAAPAADAAPKRVEIQVPKPAEGPRHLHRIPRLSEAPWEVP